MSKLKIVEERYVVTTKDKKEIIRGKKRDKYLEKVDSSVNNLPRAMLYCENKSANRAIGYFKDMYNLHVRGDEREFEKEFEKIKVRVTIEEIE